MAAALVGVITDHSINAIAYAGLLAGENTRQGQLITLLYNTKQVPFMKAKGRNDYGLLLV
jgi:hypothetical protein